jgi:hypothetical protein
MPAQKARTIGGVSAVLSVLVRCQVSTADLSVVGTVRKMFVDNATRISSTPTKGENNNNLCAMCRVTCSRVRNSRLFLLISFLWCNNIKTIKIYLDAVIMSGAFIAVINN